MRLTRLLACLQVYGLYSEEVQRVKAAHPVTVRPLLRCRSLNAAVAAPHSGQLCCCLTWLVLLTLPP